MFLNNNACLLTFIYIFNIQNPLVKKNTTNCNGSIKALERFLKQSHSDATASNGEHYPTNLRTAI